MAAPAENLKKPTLTLLLHCLAQQHGSLAKAINIVSAHAQSGCDIRPALGQLKESVRALNGYVNEIEISVELRNMQQPAQEPNGGQTA